MPLLPVPTKGYSVSFSNCRPDRGEAGDSLSWIRCAFPRSFVMRSLFPSPHSGPQAFIFKEPLTTGESKHLQRHGTPYLGEVRVPQSQGPLKIGATLSGRTETGFPELGCEWGVKGHLCVCQIVPCALGRGHGIFEEPFERSWRCVSAGSVCVREEVVGDKVGVGGGAVFATADREPPGPTGRRFRSSRSRRQGTLRSVSVGDDTVRILF